MTSEELKKLIKTGENGMVEFKCGHGGVPGDFWPSYSAFANTDGGVIVLGVKEENGVRVVEGVENAEKVRADLWNAANNPDKVSDNVLSNKRVYSLEIDGKVLVVTEVPRADRRVKPVYVGSDVFKGTYRRNGEGDYHCSREAVEAMIRDKCKETADNCLLEDMTIADLDQDSVRRYRMMFSQRKPDHAWNKMTDEQFLCKIGAAKKDEGGVVRPMLSGLLCFGDFVTISNELPDYFLDYREKTGDGTRWKDRVAAHDATWSGNIIDFYFRIYDRLTSDVKVPFKLDAHSQRVNETKVHDVLREVLANALIHADYHGRRGIVIEKQFDTIVFRNPGDLRIAKEVAIEGGTTDARNSRIFNIFALIDVGERSGMGLSNLYSTWTELGYDRPDLEEYHEPDQTVLTVYLKTSTKSTKTSSKSEKTREKKTREKRSADVIEPLKNKGETTKTVGKKTVGKGVETREKKTRVKSTGTREKKFDFPPEELVVLRLTAQRLIAVMRRNPQVTTVELAKELGVTDKGIEWQIVKLRKDKMIRRVGGRKFGSWEVLI
ncbi:MAG: putative DNA binding domain-containing protein [Kiritimatiellae bacterium]|nr:putative DNA binding domain-containing protein [Kiritimatiellia bacterium]